MKDLKVYNKYNMSKSEDLENELLQYELNIDEDLDEEEEVFWENEIRKRDEKNEKWRRMREKLKEQGKNVKVHQRLEPWNRFNKLKPLTDEQRDHRIDDFFDLQRRLDLLKVFGTEEEEEIAEERIANLKGNYYVTDTGEKRLQFKFYPDHERYTWHRGPYPGDTIQVHPSEQDNEGNLLEGSVEYYNNKTKLNVVRADSKTAWNNMPVFPPVDDYFPYGPPNLVNYDDITNFV
jgi:hypothetical protein